jgi:hypothetical protein
MFRYITDILIDTTGSFPRGPSTISATYTDSSPLAAASVASSGLHNPENVPPSSRTLSSTPPVASLAVPRQQSCLPADILFTSTPVASLESDSDISTCPLRFLESFAPCRQFPVSNGSDSLFSLVIRFSLWISSLRLTVIQRLV